MNVLAIDPGTTKSGYTFIDARTFMIIEKGKVFNGVLLDNIYDYFTETNVVIERAQPFKQVPGTLIDTIVWYGRFIEGASQSGSSAYLLARGAVKKHITGKGNSSDAMVRQSIIDRFGPPRVGKGDPENVFYNDSEERIAADMWQAYALGVTFIDCQYNPANVLVDPVVLNKIERVC